MADFDNKIRTCLLPMAYNKILFFVIDNLTQTKSMKPYSHNFGIENHSAFQVRSREEIISLLRSLAERNQLIKMLINDGRELIVTSILEVDAENDAVIIDCLISTELNQRISEAHTLSFETTFDKIRLLFSVSNVALCIHDNHPALRINVPTNFVRLQRREFYRMNMPESNPAVCIIPLPQDLGDGNYTMLLADISSNGIAVLDEQKIICQIDLPDVGVVVTTLQIRNSYELSFLHGKTKRRLGCQFIDLSKPMLAIVQRYIIKLERERNSKVVGTTS
jgi:c-di-GMP-binding flagellar brake protein YcgR